MHEVGPSKYRTQLQVGQKNAKLFLMRELVQSLHPNRPDSIAIDMPNMRVCPLDRTGLSEDAFRELKAAVMGRIGCGQTSHRIVSSSPS